MSGERILCPHCSVGTLVIFEVPISSKPSKIGENDVRYWVSHGYCQNPECERLIIRLGKADGNRAYAIRYVIPRHSSREKIDGIPTELAEDYEQACEVLDISPAASAALARRCLQGLIHEHFKIKRSRLYDEIKEAADLNTLPTYLAEGLHRIRDIGNLAAHPTHDSQMGVIVNVSREEAEWTLEILESLFKHCYLDPREYERKTQELRKKLDRAKEQGAGEAQKGEQG